MRRRLFFLWREQSFIYRIVFCLLCACILFIIAITLRLPSVGGISAIKASAGPGASVPRLTGLMEADAESSARQARIGVKVVSGKPSNEAYGTVIAQDPAAGASVPWHSTVSLTISTGPASVSVPDTTGLIYHKAAAALRDRGFSDISIQRVVSSQSVGTVVSTSPAALARVSSDTNVTLSVSIGPDADTDASPGSYLGLTEVAARTKSAKDGVFLLAAFGKGYSDIYPAGTIMAQTIDPLTPVKIGTEIKMTASYGGSGKIPDTVSFDRKKTVTLEPGSAYQGGPYVIALTQMGTDGTVYQRAMASGQKVEFPCQIEISGLSGAGSGTLCLYESDGNKGWLPRTVWRVTFPSVSS